MDNKGIEASQTGPGGPPAGCGGLKAPIPGAGKALRGRHLGDFDLDPQLDLGQDAVEGGVARAVLEMGGHRLELLQRRRGQVAAQQPDLELVERVERHPPPLDRVAPPFGGVLDSLQCNKSVDAADRPQRRGDAAGAGADSPSVTLKPPVGARRAGGGVATAAVPFDP